MLLDFTIDIVYVQNTIQALSIDTKRHTCDKGVMFCLFYNTWTSNVNGKKPCNTHFEMLHVDWYMESD